MKKNYLLLLCCIFYIQAQAQTTPNESQISAYQESLNKKEDFWSKVKHRLKVKEKKATITRTSEPVLVKNDPNRTVQRIPALQKQKVQPEESEKDNAENSTSTQAATEKRSIGSTLNRLVNGKNYVAPKKYNQVKKTKPAEEDYMAQGKIKKAERAAAKNADKSKQPVVVALTPEQRSKQQQTARQNAQYYANLNKKKKGSADQKEMAIASTEKMPPVEPEVVDQTIRNEIKPLSLLRAVSGAANYFVSGMTSGKFLVMTNLAAIGSVVKITNPQNGRYLLAEVMAPLPAGDSKRGLLLKLSDNAKMPLGQNNNSFTVKVNY